MEGELSQPETKVALPDGMYGGSKKGAKQWQEDAFFCWLSTNGRVRVGGVFDGHGGFNGYIAAHTSMTTALEFFKSNDEECEKWTTDEWKEHIRKLFSTLHETIRQKFLDSSNDNNSSKKYLDEKGIVRYASGDPIHGGTTGTVVAEFTESDGTRNVVAGNVGDSTSMLVTPDGKYEFLSVDHGPESSDEFLRIQNNDNPHRLLLVYDKASVFRKYDCPPVFLSSGQKDPIFVKNPWGNGLHPTNLRYEPAVYAVTPRQVTRDSTCIAMTRALGDFYAHQFGLTDEPSITHIRLSNDLEYAIVVASDGVWDCWKYEEVSRLMVDKRAAEVVEMGSVLLEQSLQRAIKNFGPREYDDASLVTWRVPAIQGASGVN